VMIVVLLAMSLAIVSLLAGCGGEPTPQILVVTATFTVEPVVQVVTATFTPASEGGATEAPPPVQASATPVPPEPTATTAPMVQPSQPTPQILSPTDTPPPPPPTNTSPAPTNTAVPPTATAASKPKPQASLNSYGVIYSNFDPGDQTDENKYSVWIMRGDGNQASEVLRPAFEPAFSPKGNKVALYQPFNGIWVYDLNKKTNTHVVASDYAEFPSFSPDGGQLVFHEFVGSYWSMDANLYVANADGSGRHQILDNAIRPAWSPKGNLIAFDTCRDTRCGIFVVQPGGQGFRQVTSDGGGKVGWSPDGKKLVYSAETDGDPEIWVVNVDGSGSKQLTKNSGNDTMPAYSPDGQYIYFLSDQNGTAWAIRVMKANGSDVKTVRRIGVPPRWQFSRLWVGWW
jgi:Tol biopolymer transport system component